MDNNKKSKFTKAFIAIIVLILVFKIFSGGSKYDTPEAAVAQRNAEYSMAEGFAKDEIDFKFVDAKNNEKFIIKCEAKSKDAKEIYKEIYGSDTVYFGYSSGYGGTYHYAIGDTKNEAKEKIDW